MDPNPCPGVIPPVARWGRGLDITTDQAPEAELVYSLVLLEQCSSSTDASLYGIVPSVRRGLNGVHQTPHDCHFDFLVFPRGVRVVSTTTSYCPARGQSAYSNPIS